MNHFGQIPSDPARLRWAVIIAASLLVGIAALHVALFWPGIMIWDAIRQYGQALSGHYDDWHPPAMNWLWRQLGVFGAGPAPMLVLQALLYWGGLGLLLIEALRRGRRGLALAIGAVALQPIPLVLVGTILKDSVMAGALLLASGLIAWRRPAGRWVAALLLLAAATLRFNAMPACLPLALVLLPESWRTGWKRIATSAIVAAALLLAGMPLANRLLHAEKSGVELSLVIYDLAGITRFSGTNAFPPIAIADPVTVNAACYSPIHWDDYAWWVDKPCPIQFATLRDWFKDHHTSPNLFWANAVIHHPAAYATHRLIHVDHNLRFIVDERALHPLTLQTDPNPWGFTVAPSRARDTLAALASASLWTPLGWPICWLAVAFATLLLCPREDRSLARPLAWSALLYGLSYGPLSVATEVRYHFWTTSAAALGAAFAIDAMARHGDPPLRRWWVATAPLIAVTAIAIIARL